MEKKNIHIIVQARLNSTRLNEKVIKKINGKTIIEILYDRLKKVNLCDKIIFAIPKNKKNNKLKKILKSINIKNIFEGSDENVLSRYYNSAKKFNSNIIIRVTADCPILDPKIIDKMIKKFITLKINYLSNTLVPSFPDGYDVEIFDFKTLEDAYKKSSSIFEREHVTPFIIKNKKIKKFNYKNKLDLSFLRITLDEDLDLIQLKKIFSTFKSNSFGLKEIIKLYKKNPQLFNINKSIKRNEGKDMNKGQKIWKRALNIFPNGNMFLSKNPSRFHDISSWPVYFSRTKGCNIWDLDEKRFFDFSYMGVGTNILGYNNKYVDSKVLSTIKKGNLSTLNSSEEVFLAEKLIEMHPWSEMAFFARTGGEANAISIRIARAANPSNKYKVAVCGYHGWHDWYLSSNLSNKNNLNTHLAPDLKFEGVPKSLKNTVYSFEYNDFQSLLKIIEKDQNIGIIKMEVERDKKPTNNFLHKVRKLANEKGIILIFDECTSGFRETFGGLHLKYKVFPDIAMFGKSLGNGYAITSVIGKKDIMNSAKKTFMSSTFWGERIGPTAGISTLHEMKRVKSWKQISSKGSYIKKKLLEISRLNKVPIEFSGIDALINFKFKDSQKNLLNKYMTYEMLKKNFLATNSIYVSTAHTDNLIEKYLNNINDIFYKIKSYEAGKIKEILKITN